MTKQELRNTYKKIREEVPNKNIKSEKIASSLLSSNICQKANTVCIYVNMLNEVNTTNIIEYLLKNNKIVGVPVIKNDIVEFYKINSLDELTNTANFGIKEPLPSPALLINKKDIDLIIVPGVCFDLENNRLGFGKGYYDKYLIDLPTKAMKIGICFEKQIIKNALLPIEEHDIKMDYLFTENQVY